MEGNARLTSWGISFPLWDRDFVVLYSDDCVT